MSPKISCIILNYNTAEMTGKAISHFLKAATSAFAEVIVIDNGSKESFTMSSDNRVRIIKNNDNVGFAKAVNQGLELAQGEYILLLNSDVFINAQALESMIEYAEAHSDVGIIGPMMMFPDNSFQPSAGFFPTIMREVLRFSKLGKIIPGGTLLYRNIFNRNIFLKPVKVDWVSGGCMLIKKEVIEKIGIFDSRYFFSIEDWDFCYRALQNNFSVLYLPTVSVIHYHSFSSGGHGSVYSLKQENISMNIFLQIHFGSKVFLKQLFNFFSKIKIFVFERLYKR